MLLAVALTFGVVYRSTGSQLRAEIDRSIRSGANQLRHAIPDEPQGSPVDVLSRARSYARSQPYTQAALLLFVLVPGFGTASNHPELFGAEKPDDDETEAEQDRENDEGRLLARPHVGYATQQAPDVGMLRVFEVRFNVSGHVAYAGAGETLASVDHAEDVVASSFAVGGVLALALAILAAFGIGSRITSPVRRSAAIAAQIDAGDLTPRVVLQSGASEEIQTLAEALNHMLDRLTTAFEAQRAFVADASHELRTPLTVLRGQLDVLAAREVADGPVQRDELRRAGDLMQTEVTRLTRLIDDLLLLAQSDRDDFLRRDQVALDEWLTELWDSLSLIAERRFEVGRLEPMLVDADPDRLAQALRNLARNAIAHTSSPDGLVRVELDRQANDIVRITVSDDGPGIDVEDRVRVFERFYRTDAARTRVEGGAGLGLAIVRAIAEAHGGTVRVTESQSGGAAVEFVIPAGRPPA